MTTTESSPVREKKILIIGDLIVDSTWYVNTKKLSPEAPVPAAYLTSPEPTSTPGGAGLAASYASRNLIPSVFMTAAEPKYIHWLATRDIDTVSVIESNNVVKMRYIDVHSAYHLLRVDNDDIVNPPIVSRELMIEKFNEVIEEHNIACVAVLDYKKGVFNNPSTCYGLVNVCRSNNIPIYVDTRDDTTKFIGVNCLKLNENETVEAMIELELDNPQELLEKLHIDTLIVTRGKKGAAIYEHNKGDIQIYNYVPDLDRYTGTPDVTGCGDVFDINFCYNRFIEGLEPTKSLELSVGKATQFAYELVHNRL